MLGTGRHPSVTEPIDIPARSRSLVAACKRLQQPENDFLDIQSGAPRSAVQHRRCALGIALTGCAGEASNTAGNGTAMSAESTSMSTEDAPQPIDPTGERKQSNEGSGSVHVATIVDDSITIYWVTPGEEATSLIWAGSIDQPEDAATGFTGDSVNDTTRTGSALLASSEDTKTFTPDGDTISYEARALGDTWTVELEQVSTAPAAAHANEHDATGEDDVTIEGASNHPQRCAAYPHRWG